MEPAEYVEVCRASHERLINGLTPLVDHDFRGPSLLPRFSRGHVVTHVANKARAHAWLFGGPAVGEVRHLHPAGHDADAAAEVGAGRSAIELRADLKRSFDLLEAAWLDLNVNSWNELGEMTAGPRKMVEIMAHHLRNVEVHHVDLDIGYLASDWPGQFVDGELAKRISTLPQRADHADLLAWLLGRAPAPDLEPW